MNQEGPRVRFVSANAGCGKTEGLMMALQAHIKDQGLDILCLAFNKTKADSLNRKIRDLIHESGITGVSVLASQNGEQRWACTIHALANAINRSRNDLLVAEQDWEIESKENNPEAQEAAFVEAYKFEQMLLDYLNYSVRIDGRPSPVGNIDLLLVDEIQDLRYAHIACIVKLAEELNIREVLLAGDLNQNIYAAYFQEKDPALLHQSHHVLKVNTGKGKNKNPLFFFEHAWPRLERVELPNIPHRFRANSAIPELTDKWMASVPGYRPYESSNASPHMPIEVVFTTDFDASLRALGKQLEKGEKQSSTRFFVPRNMQTRRPSPLVILAYTNWECQRIIDYLRKYGDKSLKTFDPEFRYFPDIPVRTIHSFKGEQADSIVLMNLNTDFESDLSRLDPGEADVLRSLFYVGLTRANQTLTVISSHPFKGFPGAIQQNPRNYGRIAKILRDCRITNQQTLRRTNQALQYRALLKRRRKSISWKNLSEFHIARLVLTVARDDLPFLPVCLIPGGKSGSFAFTENDLGLAGNSGLIMRVTRAGALQPKITSRIKDPLELKFHFIDTTVLHGYRENDLGVLSLCTRMLRAFLDFRVDIGSIQIQQLDFISISDYGSDRRRADTLYSSIEAVRRKRRYLTKLMVFNTDGLMRRHPALTEKFCLFQGMGKINKSMRNVVVCKAQLTERRGLKDFSEQLYRDPKNIYSILSEVDGALPKILRDA